MPIVTMLVDREIDGDRFEHGTTHEVDEHRARALVRRGHARRGAGEQHVRLAQILAALGRLDSNNPDHFTPDGKARPVAIEAETGFAVDAAERDVVLEEFVIVRDGVGTSPRRRHDAYSRGWRVSRSRALGSCLMKEFFERFGGDMDKDANSIDVMAWLCFRCAVDDEGTPRFTTEDECLELDFTELREISQSTMVMSGLVDEPGNPSGNSVAALDASSSISSPSISERPSPSS